MKDGKKILITGAAGFIGSSLVEYLLKDGQSPETLRLLIAPWDSLENLPKEKDTFEIIICDIRNKQSVDKAMKDISTVYHLAAKTVKEGETYEYYKDTNILGTKNLLDAAVKYKVKKFIYFSSIAVFGLPAWSGDMIKINEKSPKKYSEPYGRTKYEAEELICKTNSKFGLNYIIIRPTTVYGPRDKAGIFQLFKIINKGLFFFIGNGKNKMDYVYVDDLVQGARLAEKSNVSNDDFIIGAKNPITQKDIAQYICESLRKNTPVMHIPKFLALYISYIIKYLCILIGIKPIFFPDRVKVLTANCYFDISKARKKLGYNPRYSFKEGSILTANWLINNKYMVI